MSTEKDVYELDTGKAVANLQALYDSNLRLEKLMRDSMPQAMAEGGRAAEGLGIKAVALGNIVAQLAQKAFTELFNAMKEGVVMFAEDEAAYRQLEVAAGKFTDALWAQADALEKQSSASAPSIAAAQQMLLRFGVAPEAIDRTTRAILEYATANKMDLVSATQQVTRAVENGGAKLETLGIEFESTGFAAKDMATAVEGLSAKFGGSTAADNASLAGRAHQAKVAFEDVQKVFGELVTEFTTRTQIIDKLAEALRGLQTWLRSDEQEAEQEKLNALFDRRVKLADEILDLRTDLSVAQAAGDAQEVDGITIILEQSRKEAKALEEEIALLQKRNDVLAGADAGKPQGGKDRRTKTGREDDEKAAVEAQKAAEAAERARIADEKRINDAVLRNRSAEQKDKAEADRIFKEKEEAERKHLENTETLRKQAFEYKKEQWERENAALFKKAEEANKKLQELAEPWSQLGDQFFGQMAQIVTDKLMTLLTTSTKVNERMTEASLKRRQAELKEQGIYRTSEELRAEAAREAANADKKRLAEVLATMALEAGKQALMEGAKAIQSAASYDYAGAALHAASAAAFGVLAAGAGAVAYGISQDRGMTAQERQQVEADEKATKDAEERKKKDAEQDEATAAVKDKGASVNVYYLGITGQTDAEQGRELERIRAEYNGLKTGG